MGGFGGLLLSRREVGTTWLSETLHAPGTTLARHAHPVASFCLVSRGGFREKGRANSSVYRAGDVIFRAAGEEHSDLFLERGARCFNMELVPSTQGGAPSAAALVTSSSVRRLFARLRAEHLRGSPSPLVLQGLVYQILGEAFRNDRVGSRSGWLSSVRAEIDRRFDRPLTLADLARNAGVHPAHLSRTFRGAYHRSVAAYIREVRLRTALGMLRDGNRSLADIALSTGFADQSHFTRTFRRMMGTTPARFRRRRHYLGS